MRRKFPGLQPGHGDPLLDLGIDRLRIERAPRDSPPRKLVGWRTSSKLPELIELVMSKPLVGAGMVVKVLEVTPQAPRIVGEQVCVR